jgi:hypothetical protein
MSYSVKNICSGVYVYENAFANVDEVYQILKNSSLDESENSFIPKWSDWVGNWEGKASKVFPFSIKESTTDKEEKVMKILADSFISVYDDYIKNNRYTDNSIFQISDFDPNTSSEVAIEKEVSLLMYKGDQPDSKAGSRAMDYHTDTNHSDMDAPNYKKLITVTFYLNDNYEGGEISFFDQSKNKIYNYKPKAGDVTVFPSHRPYYHGVLPFYGNDRYLVRMFMVYASKGTEAWHNGVEEYGEDTWKSMNMSKIVEGYRNSENTAYMSGDNNIHPKAIVFSPDTIEWIS